ncbi:hypothetical protein [Butyrivibrio sp. VCB2006]|uniref:hypothetical protein n=1 Tax=Butyrivibrio sp. VCB2006 TaxID=1280679 RepID=UPI000416992C|nr:hypothetical protein [Butyrivibrio sp. VCB2006]
MKWRKKGIIFDPRNRNEWMNAYAQIPYPLELDDRIRIFFATREAYKNDLCRSFGAYIDVDKNDFSNILSVSDTPAISPGGIGEFDEFGTMPASVVEMGDEFYMYYCGWTRMVGVPHKEEIGIAFSTDGKNFKKRWKGPVLGDDLFEPFTQSYPIVVKFDNKLHMFYHSGQRWIDDGIRKEEQYVIRHAESKDGIYWKRDYKDLIEPKLEFESQTSPSVFYKDGEYHMFFCYRNSTDFRDNKERSYNIGYAVSNDLHTWERKDEECGIATSDKGWDSEMICYPSVKMLNGKYYMFYCGNHFGRDGFGYAVLEG